MISVVHLGHGIFLPVAIVVFSKSAFGREVSGSKVEERQKITAVLLYRSMRP